MAVVLFDLDYTLLSIDSDHAWGEHMISRGMVDGEWYKRENDRFFGEYLAGHLDMQAYIDFTLAPLAAHPQEKLFAERKLYVEQSIVPTLLPKALELVAMHRAHGDQLLIVTATNRFVTEPIATLFGIDTLLATEVEEKDGRYTGRTYGVPTFKEGKVIRVKEWMSQKGLGWDGSVFYSDSHNDLPLLEAVDRPVAVDPDKTLLEAAKARGWEVISLR